MDAERDKELNEGGNEDEEGGSVGYKEENNKRTFAVWISIIIVSARRAVISSVPNITGACAVSYAGAMSAAIGFSRAIWT